MTSDTLMYHDRCHIFKTYYSSSMTMTELCRRFNRSRTWFYKWDHRYQLYGETGLRNIERDPPAMPNITPLDVEMRILDYSEQNSSHGPVRIADELHKIDVPVKSSAAYNVLKRHDLNTPQKRLEHLRIKRGVVATPG